MRSYTDFINERAREANARLDSVIVHKHSNINDSASKGETPMTEKNQYAKENDAQRKERTGLSSLEQGDKASAAVQKTPNRVALADIEAAIKHVAYLNPPMMPHLTIAVIYLENGWAEVGHSAPADADNFDAELGKKFAYEAAMRKLWPLFGFAMRDRLSRSVPPYTGEGEGPKSGS